jgi:myo-inositol-1(or 4)-monophosphatase
MRALALAAAQAAADVILARTRDPGTIAAEIKGTGDYVTEVDRAAEAAALQVLRRGSPDIPVLAEEGGGALAELVWVVDPVDGTTNLLRAFPVVGVSVGLLEEGRPVAGAVVAPMLGEAWTAAVGQGASDARGNPLRVSNRPPAEAVVATGFPFRHKERLGRYQPVQEASLRDFEDLRRAGAACLDLAYTATGTWEGFFELGLAVWDIAAGALLVREAGGVVTDWNGDPDAVFENGNIVAGSPAWHEAMLALIAGVRVSGPAAP